MIYTHRELTSDQVIECDVCVIGSGAGGGVLAAGLVERGLDVVMLEEGGHYTTDDFDGVEATAYPRLYQDRGGRATADGAITVLQGRNVGGGTTVNWTTCFRTPDRILDVWGERYGIDGVASSELGPHWDAVEERLGVMDWPEAQANANNRVLLDGCRALGWQVESLRRNVKGCANSGYCGTGCPFNAKQGMLLTYVPDALAGGMRLYADTRAVRLERDGGRVHTVHARVLVPDRDAESGVKLTIRPKVTVVAGGAINSPALLLRSEINPNGLVGQRTLLHPVVGLASEFPDPIEGWSGAPQSIASHHFVDRGADRVGYFLECPPLQPMLAGSGMLAFGEFQGAFMRRLRYANTVIAICVDGLIDDAPGGSVSLRADGSPKLAYPVTESLAEAFHDAHKRIAEVQLAAGAVRTLTLHGKPAVIASQDDLRKLDQLDYGALKHMIFTAHQMGGCQMGGDPDASVVDAQHRVRGVDNLFVVDGSIFPTALGVNPSLTIYGLAHRAREFVADAV